jgi:hypothetical protein
MYSLNSRITLHMHHLQSTSQPSSVPANLLPYLIPYLTPASPSVLLWLTDSAVQSLFHIPSRDSRKILLMVSSSPEPTNLSNLQRQPLPLHPIPSSHHNPNHRADLPLSPLSPSPSTRPHPPLLACCCSRRICTTRLARLLPDDPRLL